MISTLTGEIDLLCNAIKHNPDNVDLEHVKSILRRVQAALDTPNTLKYPRELNIKRQSLVATEPHEVNIRVFVYDDQLEELVAWLNGIGED